MTLIRRAPLFIPVLALFAPTASAQSVTLSGLVTNSCTITLSSAGVLVTSSDGTRMGSEEGVGGLPATVAVVAVGSLPTIDFSAPVSSLAGATAEISYTSISGANQLYTTATSQVSSDLIDTFNVQGRLTKADGFPTGTHSVTTTLTCQQS